MVQSRSDLDSLATEAGSNAATEFEKRATIELVELMNAGDSTVPDAVAAAATSIANTVDAISARMRDGGRLVYVGAGSSGRIAALDASECESTFSTAPGIVVALVAGGERSSAASKKPRKTIPRPVHETSRAWTSGRETPWSA